MNSSTLVEKAIAFSAQNRVPVFPCRQDKSPTTEHGFKDASSDPAVIREMFAHVHAEYVAMPTGSITGVSVLDIDVEKDCDGVSGFEWLDANRGLIPQTRTAQTPSGGSHYYFRHVEGLRCSNGKIAQRVDVRGDGGYIIVLGFGYELFEDRPFGELPVFPAPVIGQLNDPPAIRKSESSTKTDWEDAFVPGQWHTTVRDKVASAVARGVDRRTVLELAPLLTMQGFTVEQTKHELATFYDSAKDKGWAPQGSGGFAPLQFPLPQADPLPQLPDRCVPPTLRPWLNDVAYRMDVPLDYLAAACLVAASSIIGRRAAVRPKVNDPWEEHANLWGLVIAQPGELKSPSIATALKPIEGLERVEREKWKQAEIELRKKAAVLREREAVAKSQLKDAIKKADGSDTLAEKELEDITSKLAVIDKQLANGGRRFICNDATTEKLAELCQANPYGLMISRDEISGWFELLGRAGREGDREFFLEAWSGSGGHGYDRIGRGSLYIPHVCLSIFGTIQPGKLNKLIDSAGQDGEGADGLLQRFQILLFPDARGPRKFVDEPADTDAKEAYEAVFKDLADLKWQTLCSLEKGIPVDGIEDSCYYFFHFDEAAQASATEWFKELELQIDSIAAPAFKSHIAKYRGLMPRIALTYFLIEASAGSISEQQIPLEAVEFAIEWCQHLEAHAQKLWAPSINPAMFPSAKLAEKVLSGKVVDRMEVSAIQQKKWSKLTTTDQVDLAVSQLEEWGWLKRFTRDTGGRPSPCVRINPGLPIGN